MKDGDLTIMSEGITAECVAARHAPALLMERRNRSVIRRLQTVPWLRIVVDALLVAGLLLASSSILAVR